MLRLPDVEMGRVLGRGNSSRVYLATHRQTGSCLAMKVLQVELQASRESRRQVLNEIKTVFNARSDHLVSFYDAFVHEGCIYLALECELTPQPLPDSFIPDGFRDEACSDIWTVARSKA